MKFSVSFLIATLISVTLLFSQEAQDEVQYAPGEWPREYTYDDGSKLVLYQPQVKSWEAYEHLEMLIALAFSENASESPSVGAFELEADTDTDMVNREVKASNFKITKGNFPSLDKEKSEKLMTRLKEIIPKNETIISLDRIIANLKRAQSELRTASVKPDPPKIYVSQKPAILLMFDGKPIWSPIKDNDLKYAVNTNWDIFKDSDTLTYYLRNDDTWYRSQRLGPEWVAAGKLPKSFKKLPKDENWKDVRANLPGKKIEYDKVPHVYVNTKPSELILIEGDPQLALIPDTELLWVTNTENDLFLSRSNNNFYYLVSGRWFRAENLDGPWVFATKELPTDFLKIPEDHERGHVRASVPDTPEANESAILAHIPQKATVERDKVTATVSYSGEPEFKPIEGTSMQYAANTSNDVIRVGDLYYLCYQAVWFVSTKPDGPWEVAEKIPSEIYTIPPSSPVYNTTYVQVYESSPTTVTFGYTSGYYGCYYSSGVMVYGTGWYYPPYYYWGGYYPYYYPYHASFGCGAWYNPTTGSYGRGAAVYGPYGGMGAAAAYNPTTGTYARGAVAYGPYNARGWAEAYNPRTDTYARTRQGANAYGNWGSSVVQRGDDWVRTGHASGEQGKIAGYRGSDGSSGFVGRDENNNLYAGKDGNVYKRDESGWQQYNGGDWNSVDNPIDRDQAKQKFESRSGDLSTTDRAQARQQAIGSSDRSSRTSGYDRGTYDQLNRDYSNRSQGQRNYDRTQSWNSSGGYNRGSYGGGSFSRGSYGGRSGGGFRR